MIRGLQTLALCLSALFCADAAYGQSASSPLPSVVVEKAARRVAASADSYVGRIEAIRTVAITARVEGTLEMRRFTEGGPVSKGDVLFEIENTHYRAKVDKVQATLKGAEAAVTNAEKALARKRKLRARANVAQATVDAAIAELGATKAAVGEAKADLTTAKVNLGYTRITSPIDGRVGKSSVDVGNLVNAESGVLATVTSVDPIHVSFYLSERDLIAKRQTGLIAANDSTLGVHVELSTGAHYGPVGRVDYVGQAVRASTDTIEVRATIDNNDGLLVPGQTVTVRLVNPDARPVVTVPQAALQLDRAGHFVFVLSTEDTVERRDVELGRQLGRYWVITDGLQAGTSVIVQGLQKVHVGSKVTPTEAQG